MIMHRLSERVGEITADLRELKYEQLISEFVKRAAYVLVIYILRLIPRLFIA